MKIACNLICIQNYRSAAGRQPRDIDMSHAAMKGTISASATPKTVKSQYCSTYAHLRGWLFRQAVDLSDEIILYVAGSAIKTC
jgi:hypothetical protein